MILRYGDLDLYKKKGVLVDGCFDPIHEGHIAYFKKARELGYPVFCSVENDFNIKRSKKRSALLNESSRVIVLDAIRYIDFVFLNETTTSDVLNRLSPIMYLKGKDWRGNLPDEEKAICKKNNIEIIYLDTIMDSSTKLLKEYVKKMTALK